MSEPTYNSCKFYSINHQDLYNKAKKDLGITHNNSESRQKILEYIMNHKDKCKKILYPYVKH